MTSHIEHDTTIDLTVTVTATPTQSEGLTVVPVAPERDASTHLLLRPETVTPETFTVGQRYRLTGVRGWVVDTARDERVAKRRHELEHPDVTDLECPECGSRCVIEDDLPDPPAPIGDSVGAFSDGRYLLETPNVDLSPVDPAGADVVDDWEAPSFVSSRSPTQGVAVQYRRRCPNCGHADAWESFDDVYSPPEDAVFQEHRMDAIQAPASTSMDASAEAVGMATGGSKDATNFREQIAEGYTPSPEALQYEGLFYDYYFDTGGATTRGDHDGLFYPTCATAVSEHPISGETEQYVSVGLNSTLSVADFERKPLNLVAVLDVSGSMDSPFDQYYYDEQGRRREREDAEEGGRETKIEAAREALAGLTTHLRDDDRLGVVLYNNEAGVAKPLRDVGSTDMDAIRRHIREVQAGGGTNLEAGFQAAVDLLEPHAADADPEAVENRVVFITDMMPNTGRTGEADLIELIDGATDDGIYTTFLGIGLDANPDLADSLSSVRGANHYFVNSASEFTRRLDEEFEYMVTPLVFDLDLSIAAEGYDLADVYGAPDADLDSGTITHISTLFPSPTKDGETRGGVTLLRLEKTDGALDGETADLELTASWTERDGTTGAETVRVDLPAEPESFAHDGVRKAVLLARYGRLLRSWAVAVHGEDTADPEESPAEVDDWQGGTRRERSQWEQESVPLSVPAPFDEWVPAFAEHFDAERAAIGDDDLAQEEPVFDTLEKTRPEVVRD
jgi:Ca-activated chloride channel family protein